MLRKLFLLIALVAMAAAAKTPKYIFYYIGDGMGISPVMVAQNYNRQILQNDKSLTMLQFPIVGWAQTYSYNSDITDSSAAGTALSTGHKTCNYMMAMTPDSVPVPSIASILHSHGYGVAVATSVAPDDATPGNFYAHAPHRTMFYDIDSQMVDCGYEFIAGSSLQGTMVDGKPTDVLERMAAAGVQIVHGPAGPDSITAARAILLSGPARHSNTNIGYTIDSIEGALSLPLIARTALAQLERTSPDRFFMMIEGGNIDHALHANDTGTSIKEILNFDEALKVAFDFYLAHPDETLIVVTADHDTGGMAIRNSGGMKYVDCQKISKEQFSNFCKAMLKSRNIFTWDDMKEYLTDNLGFFTQIPVKAETEAKLKSLFDDTFEHRNTADQKTLYANFNAFAAEVFTLFNKAAGISYASFSHTGNPVPVFAIGVGADRFKGFNNNIDLPGHILKAVGL